MCVYWHTDAPCKVQPQPASPVATSTPEATPPRHPQLALEDAYTSSSLKPHAQLGQTDLFTDQVCQQLL